VGLTGPAAATAFTGLWGSGRSDVYVVGGAGIALHYDGKSWVQSSTPNAAPLRAVWGSGPDDVWAVGDIILHAAAPDQRASAPPPPPRPVDTQMWTGLAIPSTAPLTAMWGTTGSLYIVGLRGQILHSIDDGATFVATKPVGEVDLNAVWAASRKDVW